MTSALTNSFLSNLLLQGEALKKETHYCGDNGNIDNSLLPKEATQGNQHGS